MPHARRAGGKVAATLVAQPWLKVAGLEMVAGDVLMSTAGCQELSY
jgi:hypothetical protein